MAFVGVFPVVFILFDALVILGSLGCILGGLVEKNPSLLESAATTLLICLGIAACFFLGSLWPAW